MSAHRLSLNSTLQYSAHLAAGCYFQKRWKGDFREQKQRKFACFLTLKYKFAMVDACIDQSKASLRSKQKSTMKGELGDCLIW